MLVGLLTAVNYIGVKFGGVVQNIFTVAKVTAMLLLVLAAFGLAYYVRYELQVLRVVLDVNRAPFERYLPYVAVYMAWLYVNYQGSALYRSTRGRSWIEEIYIIGNGVTNATVVLMAIIFVFQPLVFSRLMLEDNRLLFLKLDIRTILTCRSSWMMLKNTPDFIAKCPIFSGMKDQKMPVHVDWTGGSKGQLGI